MTEADVPFVVVVGVDGSEDSRAAGEWAVGEAIAHKGKLVIAHAWNVPPLASELAMATVPFEDLRMAAADLLAREAAHLGDKAAGLEIETRLEYGSPIHVLLDLAASAGLIVIGSRGMGRVAGLLLGSVSQAVVIRASCAVLVVPPNDGKSA